MWKIRTRIWAKPRDSRDPGRTPTKHSGKLAGRFCIARSLTVPKKGKTPVRMANFSEQTMLLRPGQTVAQFDPLDHAGASLFELEETCTKNETKQDAWVEMPPSEPPVWFLWTFGSAGQKRSFTGLLEDYGDLFAVGDDNFSRTSARVLAYGSRALHCHERNYSNIRLEMLALVDFIISVITSSAETFLYRQTITPWSGWCYINNQRDM